MSPSVLLFWLAMAGGWAAALAAGSPPFGTTWFRSSTDVNVTVVGNATRWSPMVHPDTIVTYLSTPLPLDKEGDEAKIKIGWRSDGDDSCPAECYANDGWCGGDCQKMSCVHESVRCLAGTGDFRIGFLDTNGGDRVSADGFCPTRDYDQMHDCLGKAPFDKYLGYDFRTFPHLSKKAQHEPGNVPCSIYRKSDNNLFGKDRLKNAEWGCFEVPKGQLNYLELKVKKYASHVGVTMEMNGIELEASDDIGSGNPKKIDAVAIQYPNGRHYAYVEFSALSNSSSSSTTATKW